MKENLSRRLPQSRKMTKIAENEQIVCLDILWFTPVELRKIIYKISVKDLN
jgi:hypothetical protein